MAISEVREPRSMTAANTNSRIATLIVDDDPFVRSSLKTYFSCTADIHVVAEASTGVEALSLLDQIDIDVIIADIHMPEMDGITLLREAKKRPTPPAFVAITALDTDKTMIEVLTNGGAGYVVKSSKPATMYAAVREAVNGGTAVSPHALTRLVDYLPHSDSHAEGDNDKESSVIEFNEKYALLTDTEKQILSYICEGRSNAEIAKSMHYAQSTVKKQVSHLMSVFAVSSRLSLAITALPHIGV